MNLIVFILLSLFTCQFTTAGGGKHRNRQISKIGNDEDDWETMLHEIDPLKKSYSLKYIKPNPEYLLRIYQAF